MRVYLGADHRGFALKEELKQWLIQQDHEVVDLGASSLVPDDDYVDYATVVAKSIAALSSHQAPGTRHQQPTRGVVLCGSGVGMDIVTNRFKGVRCGLGISPEQVRESREDDDINILALAADYTDVDVAKEMVKVFLETPFSRKERYIRRIKNIDE